MSAPQVMPWLDLSSHGARLSLFQLPDMSINLIMSGLTAASPEWEPLQKLGFVPSKSGKNLIRSGTNVQTAALRKLFPRNVIRQTPIDVVWLRVPGQAQEEKRDLRDTKVLGVNYLGQRVFDGENGRYIRLAGGEVISETDAEDGAAARFMRATSPADLALCSEGFVNSMLAGEVMNTRDLRYFAQIAYGEADILEVDDARLRVVQEALEAAMQRRLFTSHAGATDEAYALAVKLTEHQPEFTFRTSNSIEKQQYSTPLPMSLALQRILGDTTGMKVLELTIGNGSLISALPEGTQITGVELDPARVEQVRSLRSGLNIIEGDILDVARKLDKDYEIVIANPPFGGLDRPVMMDDLRCTRLDHQIVLTGLRNRAPDGQSVFIIAADRDSIFQQGKIAGGSKTFFNWLTDHYQVEDVVEMNPSLYKKQGAHFPVRMVTVGRRYSEAETAEALATKKHRLGDVLPVIHTWEALWAHAESVARKVRPAPKQAPKILPQDAPAVEPPLALVTSAAPALPEAGVSAETPEPARASGQEELILEIEKVENDYQAPYIPSSKINEPSAMIPRNLLEPVRKALADLENSTGMDVDSYVATKLDMDVADMQLAFSAEQVDALALAIARIEEGRGFIQGDQTGQGKGRVLAGLARYAVLQGNAIVFLTEKPNLFSDFWRDLKDIGTEDLFRPLLVNDGEPIRDMSTNKIEINAAKPGALQKLMDTDLPLSQTEYNIMFATYSQFNRDRATSKKANWLPSVATGTLLMLDESHNAAGESNTADNIALAVHGSGSTVYSSATFAKGAANMQAYSKVFPESVQVEKLADTLVAGGEPLQEILSAMLAEDGVLIRREHDLSKLEFETAVTESTRERDEEWADLLSAALREMAYFSGDMQRIATQKNKEIRKALEKLPEAVRQGNRMGVSYQGFGSRLYNILRQFALTIKIDEIADLAVTALEEGRKPVIVLEQTFESLLKDVMADEAKLKPTDPDNPEADAESVDPFTVDGMLIDAITLRDLLHRVAHKLEYIYVRDDYGNGHYEHASSMAETKEQAEAIEEVMEQIKARIDELPDIPVSPMDQLRHKIEEAGFSCSEISGRSFVTNPAPGRPGKMTVNLRPDRRLQTIQEFNNGKIDAVILTRAGSTGLSLHSSEKFADRRQRQLIEAQIANNVAERIQFWGRVNRRGQVNSPRITCPTTTLPSEIRTLAMQNTKLRKISANTQSNRNNQAELRSVPDILNKIGNEICRRYLEENPNIAALLGIDPDAQVNSEDEAYFANMLTGRIALLPVKDQKEAYEEIGRVYEETLSELESKGQNPFKTSVFDWQAKIVDQRVFRAGSAGGSVFDRPVYISRVEWNEDIEPYTADNMRGLVAAGRTSLTEKDARFTLVPGRYGAAKDQQEVDCKGMLGQIEQAFARVQEQSLRAMPQFSSLQEALRATEHNPIKNTEARKNWLKQHLRHMTPGAAISFSGPDDEPVSAMVCNLYPPMNSDHAHLLGQYTVRVATPGSDKLRIFTLNQLQADPLFTSGQILGDDWRDPYKAFDSAKPGTTTFSRVVLTGNMFAAAQFAGENKTGRSAIFTDANGARHRAIIMPTKMTMDDALRQPVSLAKNQVVEILRRAHDERATVRLVSHVSLEEKYCTLVVDANKPGMGIIRVNGNKNGGGRIFNDPNVVKLTGDFSGTRAAMSVSFPIDKLEAVVDALVMGCGQGFFVDAAKAKALMPALADPAQEDEEGEIAVPALRMRA